MFSPRNIVCFLPVFLVLLQLHRKALSSEPEVFSTAPSCLTHECPPYTVLEPHEDYEIRMYQKATWISSPKIPSSSYRPAANQGFLLLYSYFQGNNTEGVKINMTAPVFVRIKNQTYTVYFYVPQKYQCGTPLPRPVSKEITRVELPELKYAAVRRFSGFTSNDIIVTELDALRTSLNGSNWYEQVFASTLDEITVAGYNNPFEKLNRVNELIIFFNLKLS